MPPIDLAGQVPEQFSTQIITEAAQQSVVLSLGTRYPMGSKVTSFPVPKTFPQADFVTVPGGRKPFTDLKLTNERMTAEEISAVVAVPDEYVQDASVNIWGYVRPQLAEAIGQRLDDAVLWGVNPPTTYPQGGVAAYAVDVPTAEDAVATVNDAMSALETQGLQVTGFAADVTVQGALRGVRDASGALLMGAPQAGSQQQPSLYGVPIKYSQFPATATADLIAGGWKYLLVGVRQDIRYQFSTDGVIADDDGKIIVSAYQDNQTLLKVWARFGCVIVLPATRRVPGGAKPFAIATLTGEPAGTESVKATKTTK